MLVKWINSRGKLSAWRKTALPQTAHGLASDCNHRSVVTKVVLKCLS